jgi:hypothetical protein
MLQNDHAVRHERRNVIVWFWIGTHADYDHLLQRLSSM